MSDYSRKITPICCHAYRVNRVWEEADNRWVNRLTIEPQTFCGLKEIELKTRKIQRKNQQYVTITQSRLANKKLLLARWGLFYGTERNGTERNDGLNCGTECFLRLKLAAYHCCTSYQWHFQQVIKRYPKKDKTNLSIDCGFLLVVISNEVLIVGIADSVCSSSDISSRELMHDLFLLVCELFLLT